jgi:hypothetical protein
MKYQIEAHNQKFLVYINSTVEKIFNLHEGKKFTEFCNDAIKTIFPLIANEEKEKGLFYIEKAILKELYRRIGKKDGKFDQNFLIIL